MAVAGLTAAGLARVWPLKGRAAVVWGAAGTVARMLVATLADHGVDVIGIASGKLVDAGELPVPITPSTEAHPSSA